jgi:hypothetical protein
MRNIRFLILSLLFSNPAVFSQETGGTNGSQVLLAWGATTSSDPFDHSFYFNRSQLPSKVSWARDKPFPVDLGLEAVRAYGFLEARIRTNDFKLFSISVSPGSLGVEWMVHFRFYPESHWVTNLYVDMLLDGTYAEERLQRKTKSEVLENDQRARARLKEKSTPRQTAIVSDTNIFSQTQTRVTQTNASDLVKFPDFVVPRVQWKWGEPFPVDLSVGAAQAQTCLNHPESFVLREIDISHYLPDAAIGHSADAFLNNLDHWFVRYYFNSSEEKAAYWVYMLLDRRILCVASRDY